ncbi:pseudouridine synthase [Shewanella sp. SNU WT4]|uniref:pseudouridine synthase n=1 Tax=Shewanella sp. SNU WT4 TaxID=2590015 RepID=UPI00112A703E|nr:pseudouridine synthase [Shewanella sp. SNU WT4]QDF66803.1 pseudouridine synthase [Shewanella sp. SNU WT4]
MRLDKFICKSTELTRAQATSLIAAGKIAVNGEYPTLASMQVHENNCITLNGERLIARPSRYIMLHKPAGTLCSNVDGDYPSVFNYLNLPNSSDMHIAGRLDADTTGLVLITDDGRWSFKVFNPQFVCEKIYRVDLRDPLDTDEFLRIQVRFAEGLLLPGETADTLAASIHMLTPRQVLLSISEGRYHQVKRMFAFMGNKVVGLHRQQVGAISLDIAPGEWRHLTPTEVASVFCDTD